MSSSKTELGCCYPECALEQEELERLREAAQALVADWEANALGDGEGWDEMDALRAALAPADPSRVASESTTHNSDAENLALACRECSTCSAAPATTNHEEER